MPRNDYERAFYGNGGEVLTPGSPEELFDVVREAHAHSQLLIPDGMGSQAYLGVPPADDALVISTRRLAQVIRYEPDDFTIGVQAGLPLVELSETLKKNRQEIPLDVSSRSSGSVGGWVAAGFPGPRTGHHGGLRNYMIGASGLRGGQPPSRFKTGGMVVKNVAGYDVGKFLIGSLGTAGFILEANFKLRALPEKRSLRLASFRHQQEAWSFSRELRRARFRPVVLSVFGGKAATALQGPVPQLSAHHHPVAWAFEGNTSQVDWQNQQVDKLLSELDPAQVLDLSDEEVSSLMDFLCEFSQPEPGVPPADLGIARLDALPTGAEKLEKGIYSLPEAERSSFATLTDVLTGAITLRWIATGERLTDSLPRLQALAASQRASGVILYLPP